MNYQNSLILIVKTKNRYCIVESLAFIEIIVILHKSMLLCERTIFYNFDQFNLFRCTKYYINFYACEHHL